MSEKNEYDILLDNIQERLGLLKHLLITAQGLTYEDRLYRFYHHSGKVYYLQELTEEIVKNLAEICPHDREPFCDDFQEIYNEGTGWEYDRRVRKSDAVAARRIVEAFLHAKYFLEMVVKYGEKFENAPINMPSGWAALSKLYRVEV